MYANIAETVYAPGQREAAQAQIEEFHALGAQQPGYRRTIQVDAGEGCILTLTLWDSAAALEASRPVMGAVAERLLRPHWTGPSRRPGFGEVVRDSRVPGATYAVLVANTFAPGQSAAAQAQSDEYRALSDGQQGARGAIFIASDDSTLFVLRLWASEAEQRAAAPALREAFERLIAPQLAAPMRPLGAGAIVRDTLTRSVSNGD